MTTLLISCYAFAGIMLLAFLASSGPSSAKGLDRRLRTLRERHSDNASARAEAQVRKAVAQRRPQMHQVAGSQSRIAALALRLHRTGKGWSVQKYVQVSGGIAAVIAALIWFKSGSLPLALAVGLFVGAGLPHKVVGFLINKRSNAFTTKFPDAIELLVRGLRSGLPVGETLGVVGHEVPGPVGEEFRMVTDRMRVGRTMDEALQETADRLNTPEFNFFCITLAIQRETGGNLAETLANLANVLRSRAQMKLKIKAMSSESKASAYIVGSLPFLVWIMVWWANPQYLAGFFTDDRLIVAGIGGMVWMGIGVFIMSQMINFEI